ncbi:DUF2236 domain-containing protein [Xanthomonas hyacinthi]|nr:DUF2236 domain-containing protein [Xanthomonas hyacinthi]
MNYTRKLELKPHRRFQDGNDYFMAWMVDGPSSSKGREAISRLNHMHMAIAKATPGLPGNFDDVDDFIFPLAMLATFGHNLQKSLGLPGLPGYMQVAWHHWAAAVFRQFERESGPLTNAAFPRDFAALQAFYRQFDARAYEQTETGHIVASAMLDFFAERWFPRPLRWLGRDICRYLAGERVCNLHRIGWLSPGRRKLVELILKRALARQPRASDEIVPLTEKLEKTRLSNDQLKALEPYQPAVKRAACRG